METINIDKTAQCTYDDIRDKTEVVWATKIVNNTIYHMDGFRIQFNFYNGKEEVGTEVFDYDKEIKLGKEYEGQFVFYVEGEITAVEYVGWSANQVGFWDTYSLWIIIAGIVAVVGAIVFIIFMIVESLDLDDIFGSLGVVGVIAFFILGGSGSLIFWNWVYSLIVLGAVVGFLILSAIAYGIYHIFE